MSNSLQTILSFSFVLFFLFTHEISGRSIQNTFDIQIQPSKYNVDAISKLKIQNTCQTISDCSEGALECQNVGDISYCVYPDYVCTNAETCYPVQQKNDINAVVSQPNHNGSTFELIQNNSNEKYVLNSCFDIDNNENEKTNAKGIKGNCIVSVCSNDGECLSNECVSGQCPMNLNTPTFYCNAGTTEYKCRKLVDTKCQDGKKNCSTTSSSNELKYVFISVITLAAIVVIAAALMTYYKKAKPIDESNIKSVSSVVYK
jgi:hypothetical protein